MSKGRPTGSTTGTNYPLIEARKRAGLKQSEVAEILGVKQTTISLWESDPDKAPAVALMKKLAELYGCGVKDLLTD